MRPAPRTDRRATILAAGAAATLVMFAPLPAVAAEGASSYPSRPVRIVCGFPPGGISDTYGRLIAQWLSDQLGQQFIVDNRPGAGGTLAAELVARASPDGYTLLLTTSADTWSSRLYAQAKFDLARDFAAVGPVARSGAALVVHPSIPATTVPALIALTRTHGGKVTMASAGIGSAPHMFWELFRTMAKVEMVHVPYRGAGPAVTDLLGGQVAAFIGSMAGVVPHVKAGRLRALAVTTARRSPALPDVPPMADHLPGFEGSIFVGLTAPRGTAADLVERLNRHIVAGVADPKLLQRIADFGDSPAPMAPAEFSRLIADESEKWARVIREARIRAE